MGFAASNPIKPQRIKIVGAHGGVKPPRPTAAAATPSATPSAVGQAQSPAIPDPYGTIPAAANTADKTLTNTVGGITAAEDQTARDLGLTLTRDPTTGLVSGYSIDPNVELSNPYSKAALLERNYKTGQARTLTSYAAAGHLYSSALGGEQGNNTFRYGQGVNDLLSGFGRYLLGTNSARGTAQETHDTTINNARTDAIHAALANPALSAGYGGSPVVTGMSKQPTTGSKVLRRKKGK
jgi:hypothetical protein